ncbi:hypothetical protein SAMN05216420_101419 [Nitrosospira sp. Nl5]|uniref:hypothetical protein n=1 Tax=Nitrosospira sp. Nl5 TaxID=200120 RepID=UPI00088DD5EE|nr:hypothetical protein [Nitrosospira sp. Nl5]SCX94832.1 hypothetical protein SAMN05216420_101419 [Nitrosospira sp. Nl5]
MAQIVITSELKADDSENAKVKADLRVRCFDMDDETTLAVEGEVVGLVGGLLNLGKAGAAKKAAATAG